MLTLGAQMIVFPELTTPCCIAVAQFGHFGGVSICRASS